MVLANASATAVSAGLAASSLFMNKCCGTSSCSETPYYPTDDIGCCDVTSSISKYMSIDGATDNVVQYALYKAAELVQGGVKTAVQLREYSLTSLMSKSASRKTFLLSCCCCNETVRRTY